MKTSPFLVSFFTAIFFLISCSKEPNNDPVINDSSFEARIGEIISIEGSNLSEVKNLYFYSEDVDYGTHKIEDYRFISQTENEIKFEVPRVNSENYIVRVAGKNIPLKIKGFIPLNVFNADLYPLNEKIVLIDEETALVSRNGNLEILKNGFYELQTISSDVINYGVHKNGDAWFIKENDNFLEVLLKKHNENDFARIKTFNIPVLNYRHITDIIYTQNHKILINLYENSSYRNYYVFGDDSQELNEIIPNLPEMGLEEKFEVYKFIEAPNGDIYCDPNYASDYLVLDIENGSHRIVKNLGTPMGQKINFYKNFAYDISEDKIGISNDFGINWNYKDFSMQPSFQSGYYGTFFNVMDSNTFMIFQFEDREDPGNQFTKAYISRDSGRTWENEHIFGKYQRAWISEFSETTGLIFFRSSNSMFNINELYKYVR